MSITVNTLATIVTGVSAIASGVVSVYENGEKLLEIMKAAIVKVEEAYASLKAAGATKKRWCWQHYRRLPKPWAKRGIKSWIISPLSSIPLSICTTLRKA